MTDDVQREVLLPRMAPVAIDERLSALKNMSLSAQKNLDDDDFALFFMELMRLSRVRLQQG